MKRAAYHLAMLLLFVVAIVAALAQGRALAGSADNAQASIRLYYGQLVRESSFRNARVGYSCHADALRPRIYTCRTTLRAGSPRRVRVVYGLALWCSKGRGCWIEKRLITWRYP